MRRVLVVAGVVGLLAGCAPSSEEAVSIGEPAGGWTVEVVRDGLDGPTQVTAGPAGLLHVAELAGGEDEGVGRVSTLGFDGTGDRATLLEELLTPTGLAVTGEQRLFVQEQATLSSIEFTGEEQRRTVLEEDLPSNGRSHGTLSLFPLEDGREVLLATQTGTGSGPEVGTSGRLYAAGIEGRPARTVAVGFKNAYAHAVGPDGELYVTEIGDGRYDGERPPDELNVIPADVWQAALDGGDPYDGGWPRCTGDADPTEEFGATAAECEALPRPLATFPPRATPTSVAVTTDGRVLVALWVEGRVVEVDRATGDITDVVTDLEGPQHLLAREDGTVLLTVHGTGHLLRLSPPG